MLKSGLHPADISLFVDYSGAGTRIRRIKTEIADGNCLLKCFMEHTVDVLDGFSGKRSPAVVWLIKAIVHCLNSGWSQCLQFYATDYRVNIRFNIFAV